MAWPSAVRPSLHVDMELADALGLHHVVVNVAHGDGVGDGDGVGVGVGVRSLARISHVSSKVNERTQSERPKRKFISVREFQPKFIGLLRQEDNF